MAYISKISVKGTVYDIKDARVDDLISQKILNLKGVYTLKNSETAETYLGSVSGAKEGDIYIIKPKDGGDASEWVKLDSGWEKLGEVAFSDVDTLIKRVEDLETFSDGITTTLISGTDADYQLVIPDYSKPTE